MSPMSAPAPPHGTEEARRADSMLLLRDLVEGSLDDGYARAAARRAAGEPPGRGRTWVLAVGLLAVGLLLATAFVENRSRAGSAAEARNVLVAEVQQRADENATAQRRLDRQRAAVQREQRQALALTSEGAALASRLDELEVATGAGAVSGPGMVVRLDDAPAQGDGTDLDPRTDSIDEGRVTDRDLQTVVNEIWAAGAEAVAINGQRLTALSAIRAAGEAVLVDFRPISPPYVVSAVGDPDRLRSTFVGGFGGSYLQVLQSYGITSSVRDDDRLELPASAGVSLRYAAPAARPEPAGSTPGSTNNNDKSTSRSGEQ